MTTIDEYSVCALPIYPFFQQTCLGTATGFLWKKGEQYFLITNWHVVSGKNPITGQHTSKHAAEPDRLQIWWFDKSDLRKRPLLWEPLRDEDGTPLWWIHPQLGNQVDVVAIPVSPDAAVDTRPINEMAHEDLAIQVGMDVFVLGFPYGSMGNGGLAIWKRGSVASEPSIKSATIHHLLVDTASRPGMSGAPVLRRSWGSHLLEDGRISLTPYATRFLGVYSGRIVATDPLDAQLGMVWPERFVSDIVQGGRRDPGT
jgi:hypothetical protein